MEEYLLPDSYEDILHLPIQFPQLDNGESFLISSELLNENGVAIIFKLLFGKRILENNHNPGRKNRLSARYKNLTLTLAS